MPKDGEWVSEKRIAEIYGISERKLQKDRLRKPYKGFPFKRFGRAVRYNVAECKEYSNNI